MNRIIALVVLKAALGAGLALGFAVAPHGTAHPTLSITTTPTPLRLATTTRMAASMRMSRASTVG